MEKPALFNECRFFFALHSVQKSLGTEKYRRIGDKLGTEYVSCPQWGQNWGQTGDRIGDEFLLENHRVECRLFDFQASPEHGIQYVLAAFFHNLCDVLIHIEGNV